MIASSGYYNFIKGKRCGLDLNAIPNLKIGMNKNVIPITLLTGYLGAGKTTLVNYILNNQEGYKVAVIVNDIGEVNIDANLIEKGGLVTEKDESLVPLSNGCICCTLRVDLMKQIVDIAKTGRFDYILIEASGICEPLPIAQTITMMDGSGASYNIPEIARLDNVVTVVDASRLVSEFNNGNDLLEDDIDEEDIASLLIQQIEFCNKIILNKVDTVSKEELEKVKSVIRKLQPTAEIIETNYGKVDIDKIINTNAFDFEEASSSAGWIKALEEGEEEEESEVDEYGINSFVYYRREPLNREKFEEFVQNWERNIIRCKGIVWFSDERDNSYVFEQAGKQIDAYDAGIWIASAPEKEKAEILNQNPEILEDWDETYGDRMTKLVFIGQKLDKNEIAKKLDECLDK